MTTPTAVLAGQQPAAVHVPEWVALSGITADALALHVKLLMCVARGSVPWPGTSRLAALMGVSPGEAVVGWLRELVEVGALEVARGPAGRNVYTVCSSPPAGYAGPLTLEVWETGRTGDGSPDEPNIPALVATAARPAPAEDVSAPIRILDPSDPRPRCRQHRGELASGCNRCASEAKGATDDDPGGSLLPATSARDMIRQRVASAAAGYRAQDRRAVAVRGPVVPADLEADRVKVGESVGPVG